MFAPLIGIDGAAEGDIRREVVADDGLGLDLPHLGSGPGRTKCRLPFHCLPAIIDGIDLRQLDPADLRRNVGFVGQDATLFYGSLRENIAIGAPYADDTAIVAAAEVAGLTQFVNRHPKGFDMLIGERGESLSGGQRQEVAIARAVLMDPPILLFDEPTSSMDYSTEQTFKERLARFAAHKTLVIVTHRSSLIDLGTRIIVMDAGQVVADGPRDQVVEALQAGRVGRATS
jgi:ATP-binding cassette subfamily C protein LapB